MTVGRRPVTTNLSVEAAFVPPPVVTRISYEPTESPEGIITLVIVVLSATVQPDKVVTVGLVFKRILYTFVRVVPP